MNKLKSIWQIEDLRKKILFTLLLILVFRLGCSIPVPFVSNTALDSMFSNDSIFGYMNMQLYRNCCAAMLVLARQKGEEA